MTQSGNRAFNDRWFSRRKTYTAVLSEIGRYTILLK
jgi:hypothetical protein